MNQHLNANYKTKKQTYVQLMQIKNIKFFKYNQKEFEERMC